jgi:hypothetical protein
LGRSNVGRETIDSLDVPLLFNLKTDIEERVDVSLKYPEKVNELLIRAAERRKELGDWNVKGYDEHELSIPKEIIVKRLIK